MVDVSSFTGCTRFLLPAVIRWEHAVGGALLTQLAAQPTTVEGTISSFRNDTAIGRLLQLDDRRIFIGTKKMCERSGFAYAISVESATADGETADFSASDWIAHPERTSSGGTENAWDDARASWADAFRYVAENPVSGVSGLRPPQIGALHALQSHWSYSEEIATIVLPTGTGKTETMLATLIAERCERILVVVPTDALRSQLAEKFKTLGILRVGDGTLLAPGAHFPVVATLHRVPKDASELLFATERCNVLVTTSQIVGRCPAWATDIFARLFPYYFIDEAHHAQAATWMKFRDAMARSRIVQFTATPFREDGKRLDGKIVYKYPLRNAQAAGYFKPIEFEGVLEFSPSNADQAVAARAIHFLRRDLAKGHILMARVDSIQRAKKVASIYERYPEFRPVQLHSGIASQKERKAARDALLAGRSRIVICVDMLGEGFDLPELKIAAFHDIRKSLAVTLQLAGRFTRHRPDLGNAVFVANVADIHVQDELRKLYSRDPDWNILLPRIADEMVEEQVNYQEFLRDFGQLNSDLPLRSIRPTLSTVVYRTTCSEWNPDNFRLGLPSARSARQVHSAVNHREHTLVVVSAFQRPLKWSDVETISDWSWELNVVYWDSDRGLLFIHGSENSGLYVSLARAVADPCSIVSGQVVFRSLHGITRLQLKNVGLTEHLGRNVRYVGRMGADVERDLTSAQRRSSVRSVVAGAGFSDGSKVTVGASRRGRIWSMRNGTLKSFVKWCEHIGSKLVDESIDPDQVLRGTLEGRSVSSRPNLTPIAIAWPEVISEDVEGGLRINFGDQASFLSDVSLEVVNPSETGPLQFELRTESATCAIELRLHSDAGHPDYEFVPLGSGRPQIAVGEDFEDLCTFFYQDPPFFWFSSGASLEGNELVELKEVFDPFDRERLETWDWSATNIRIESLGQAAEPSSIQAAVVRRLLQQGDTRVVFNDDGAGEMADIVAIWQESTPTPSIVVEMYHCKYSSADMPGARIEDLYAVCGQAQKSISWATNNNRRTDAFTHLLRREANESSRGRKSRILSGSTEDLLELRERSRSIRVDFRIVIVQPGLSKARASQAQLELLSVTEGHLMQTYRLPLRIVCSE